MVNKTATGRCQPPRCLPSTLSAPNNMMTKRNNTMMAPAYTVTCAMAMKGAPSSRKNTATVAKFKMRNRAEYTALRLNSMPSAAITATVAKTKKSNRSMLISIGVFHHRDGAVEEALLHLLRSRLPTGCNWLQQHLASVDGLRAIHERKLVIVAKYDCFGWAGIFTITAIDAAQHIDLVSTCIALSRGVARFVRILGGLHENGVCRAGRCAQRAADAFLQSVVVALQYVAALETMPHWALDLWILRGNRAFKHRFEGDPHPFEDFHDVPEHHKSNNTITTAVRNIFNKDSGSKTFQPKAIRRS